MDASFPAADPAAPRPRSAAGPREVPHPADRERGKAEDFGALLQAPPEIVAPEPGDAGVEDLALIEPMVAVVAMAAAPPAGAADLLPAEVPAAAPVSPALPILPAPPAAPPIEGGEGGPRSDGGIPLDTQAATPGRSSRSSATLPVTAPEPAARPEPESPAPDLPVTAAVPPRRADGPTDDAQPLPLAPIVAPPAAAGDEPAGGPDIRPVEAAQPAWQPAEAPTRPARTEALHPLAAAQASPAPRQVVAQVAVAISGAPDDRRLEIRLDPPELGRVQIHLTRHDGAVQAVVMADRPETQDLLRRHSDVLASELGDAGYEGVTLDFPRPDARPQREGPASHEWAPAPGAEPAAPASVAAVLRDGPRGGSAGALDIRL